MTQRSQTEQVSYSVE